MYFQSITIRNLSGERPYKKRKGIELFMDRIRFYLLTANSYKCQTLFWGAPKSLQMVTAAMRLKDTYSLEGKL